jgi:hypothetical protein
MNDYSSTSIEDSSRVMSSSESLTICTWYKEFIGSLKRLQSIDSAFVPNEVASKEGWIEVCYSDFNHFKALIKHIINSRTQWLGNGLTLITINFEVYSFRDYFCSLLTSLYGLFLIVFAIVMELSQKLMPDGWFIEMVCFLFVVYIISWVLAILFIYVWSRIVVL